MAGEGTKEAPQPSADEGQASYEVRSTSRRTATVEPIVISLRENEDGSARRLRLVTTFVDSPPTPDATLRATLVYQRRITVSGPWIEDNFNLATLRAGQEVRMELHSAETLKLYRELTRLYAASAGGVRMGRHAVAVWDGEGEVVPSDVADQIAGLLDDEGIGVLGAIARLRPDLATIAALVEDHRQRAADLAEFEEHLAADPPDWDESGWQKFFRRCPWIFGHGLNYMFLVDEQAEPDYGGDDLGGTGGERGDELMHTAGEFRFAVLVELKRPDTALISGKEPYRNGAWRIGPEVAGGVSQLQANCERIQIAADEKSNVRWLDERRMTVADPQGILLVGHTRQLKDDDQRASFHRFRRNLWNPTVLTYDELLERARFLVAKAAAKAESATDLDVEPDDGPDADDALPF